MMASPALSPAAAAGVPAIGAITVMCPATKPISTPMPPKCPSSSSRITATSSTSRYAEWGSSPRRMPEMARSTSASSAMGST